MVVLPASGCEIIAKVRRLATSWDRLDINNGNLIGLGEKRSIIRGSEGSGEPIDHYAGIFSSSGIRIVTGPVADFLKPLAGIQRSCRLVALPDFQNHLYHAIPDGFRHGVTQQVTASSSTPQSRVHAHIQQMSLINHIVDHGITDQPIALHQCPQSILRFKTVPEHRLRPGMGIPQALQFHDSGEIGFHEAANRQVLILNLAKDLCRHQSFAPRARIFCHNSRFSTGLPARAASEASNTTSGLRPTTSERILAAAPASGPKPSVMTDLSETWDSDCCSKPVRSASLLSDTLTLLNSGH